MNTEQKYPGRGNYASPPPQTGENTPNSPLSADNRPTRTTTHVEVNRALYEAQTKLLALVDKLKDFEGVSGPIETINHLLYEWLSLPTTDLANLPRNRDHLYTAFELVNFLSKAFEQLDAIQQREVSRD